MRTVIASRYVTPLREGGSLPAIVDADDGSTWVVKFRGAGQGPKALVAEVIAGTIARGVGLPVPELAVVELDASFGRNEPHDEIRDLLNASVGANLGLSYLAGAVTYDPAADPPPDGALASRVVAFDAFVTNVDRTPRNANLLRWRDALWLIDHGAALVFQHAYDGTLARAASPFAAIKDHVLLRFADELATEGAALVAAIDDALIDEAVAAIPDAWVEVPRDALAGFLRARRAAAAVFLEEAARARRV